LSLPAQWRGPGRPFCQNQSAYVLTSYGCNMPQTKKPADLVKSAGRWMLISALYLTSTGLRRHVRRVMVMMMAMYEGNHEQLC
jgi:hypothetical protein